MRLCDSSLSSSGGGGDGGDGDSVFQLDKASFDSAMRLLGHKYSFHLHALAQRRLSSRGSDERTMTGPTTSFHT